MIDAHFDFAHNGLRVILKSRAQDKGTDLIVADHQNRPIMETVMASDIAQVLADVFETVEEWRKRLTPASWAPTPADVDAFHRQGVEATLRARIATLEGVIKSKNELNAELLQQLYAERETNQRLSSERPSLVGQRNAWRDIAARLHDILKNKDPS